MKLKDNPFRLLPLDYEEKIKRFYQEGGKEEIQNYAKEIEKEYNIEFRNILWDDKRGLTNISNSPSTGIDLIGDNFEPHNIYNIKFPEAKPLVKVILKYLSILETIK